MLVQGIRKFYHVFPDRYHLLGLGMHPTLTPDRAVVWDHDEGEYYQTYDRLFNIRQHGWLNIQALQVNLSYAGEKDLLMQYNRIRTLLPYLVALSASSPMVEGSLTGAMDNRLDLLPAKPEGDPRDLQRDYPGPAPLGWGVQEGAGRGLRGAPGTGRGDPLRGVAQFERAYHPFFPELS